MNESFWQRLACGVHRGFARRDWPQFAGSDWPARIMAAAVTDRFHAKQGRSTGRWVLATGQDCLSVYLKRHYSLPRWRGWLATIWPRRAWSPAMQEWQHLEWAKGQGLPVPEPVAAGEYIGPWGQLQSYLAIEELSGMLPLHEAIPLARSRLTPARFGEWKRGLTQETARLARMLHDRCHFHKDLYLCHFYVPERFTQHVPDWRGQVHLIDLHRLGHHPWTGWLWRIKDLAQLFYSSNIAGVDAKDRLRFWTLYWGSDGSHWKVRLARRLVERKGRRYLKHNARKPKLE